MKKYKKKRKKTKYLIIIISFLLILSYFEINSNYRIGGLIRDIIYSPFRKSYYKELYTLVNEELKKENKELKDILNIDYSSTDYELINASVIERNNTYWLAELTINKGSDDLVSKNQIVITKNGMIGKVISVSDKTSIIKLITAFSEPILVDINGLSKVMTSDNYNLYIKGINNEDNISKGDKVITSGLSNNYPRGILIGEIEEIKISSDKVGKIARVKLSQSLDDIRFVSALKRKNI